MAEISRPSGAMRPRRSTRHKVKRFLAHASKQWHFYAGIAAFVIGWISLAVTLAESRKLLGDNLPTYWVRVRAVGILPITFTFFFGASSAISLLVHWLLSYERQVRKVACLASLMAIYIVSYLGLACFSLTTKFSPFRMVIHELSILVMFYCICGACGDGKPLWVILQVLVHVIVVIIMASTTNPIFDAGGDVVAVLENKTGWRNGVFITYFVIGGLLRLGALRDGQVAQVQQSKEVWWYRILTIVHLAAYFTFLARPAAVKEYGYDSAYLLHTMIILVVYCVTPLLLVHFIALSHVRSLDAAVMVSKANRKAEIAHQVAESRQQFLRYVFHEVRVPFNSIVLGFDELKSYPEVMANKALAADLQLMQAAAATMQAVLNDTLDVEKMHSGTYKMELRPTSVEQTLSSVVSNMLPWARQDQVKISVDCDERLPQLVLADPNRLSQVVANFVSNGIKFVSKDGDGTVDVKARVIAGPSKLPYISTTETTPTSVTEERIRFPFLHRTLARILQFGDTLCECPYRAVDASSRKLASCLRRCRSGAANEAARAAEESAARDLERAEELPAPIGIAVGIPSFNSGALPHAHLGVTSRTAAAHRFSVSVLDGLRIDTPDSSASKSHSRFGTPPVEPVTVLDSHATGTCPPIWVRIEVTDNGVGINDTDKQRLFKAFVQLDAGVRQKGKGTGLGLHICKEIMTRMGGYVGVESTPGRGSTFFAEFPVQIVEKSPTPMALNPVASTAAQDPTVVPGASPIASGALLPPLTTVQAPLKILVVDDVSTNRVFLARAIRRIIPTAQVHEAADGLEAAHMVEPDISFYDVICMDKEMPVLDGYDATVRLRERGFRGQIIGVTANALTEDVQNFMACGLDTVVTKPVDVKELLRKVQRFTGRQFSMD